MQFILIHFGFIVKYSDSIEKNIGGYTLRKPYFRQKMRILKQSHRAEKRERQPFGFFNIQFVAKYQKIERKSRNRKKVVKCRRTEKGTF